MKMLGLWGCLLPAVVIIRGGVTYFRRVVNPTFLDAIVLFLALHVDLRHEVVALPLVLNSGISIHIVHFLLERLLVDVHLEFI